MLLKRFLIEKINFLFLILKKNRKLKVKSFNSKINLNLGCGLDVTKNWVNIDGSLNALIAQFPNSIQSIFYKFSGAKRYYNKKEFCKILSENIFVHHDLSKNIPFFDNTVENIFSSHFFEHLYRNDAKTFLKECHRVLQKKGILRISIPDLKFAINLYNENKKDEMMQKYFFVEEANNDFSRHKYMYDFDMIKRELVDAGFKKIRRCKFKEGNLPDVDRLDNRPKDSLFVEAVK